VGLKELHKLGTLESVFMGILEVYGEIEEEKDSLLQGEPTLWKGFSGSTPI